MRSERLHQTCFRALVIAVALVFVNMIGVETARAIEFGESVTGQTVKDRLRAEVDPRGIHLGAMWLFPSLSVTGEYNSNIFARDNNFASEIDDYILILQPAFVLKSDWSNHQLEIYGNARIGRYDNNGTEDFEDYDTGFRSRLDFTRRTNLTINGRFQRLHEDRGVPVSLGAANAINPVEFSVFSNETVLYTSPNRASLQLKSDLRYFDYDDVMGTGPSGNFIINNDDRDRVQWLGSVRAGYEVSTGTRFFALGYADIRDYKTALDDFGFNRDSNGYGIAGGLTVEVSGTLSLEGYIGYQNQDFDDPSFADISGVVWELEGVWLPSGLTTVAFHLERIIGETTLVNGSGIFMTTFEVGIDHEFLRNLIASLVFEYQKWDYQGITRKDDYIRAGVELVYMMNRNLRVILRYRLVDRDSNIIGQDYKRNSVSLILRGAF